MLKLIYCKHYAKHLMYFFPPHHLLSLFFFFFNLATAYIACGTLIPQLGIKLTPPALEG